MYKFIMAALVALLSVAANAADQSKCTDCRVTKIQPDNRADGTYIFVEGTWEFNPNCSTTQSSKRFFLSKSESMATEILSVALSAQATERSVDIMGLGTCPYFAIEDVAFIAIN